MSNNFTSGMAGPAAVETLNLLWDRVTEQIVGNSTTSLAIGTGAKTLTIEASKQFALGQTARITYNSDINKWMQGTVSAYNASTGSLSITVDTISGSGTSPRRLRTPARNPSRPGLGRPIELIMPAGVSHSRCGGLPARGSNVIVLETKAAKGKSSITAEPKARWAARAS